MLTRVGGDFAAGTCRQPGTAPLTLKVPYSRAMAARSLLREAFMADAKRQSSLGADFSRRSPFTRRCACCVDHLRSDASFRPALVGVPTRMGGARLTLAPLSALGCDCVSAGGRVTVWCGHQLAGHRLVGSRALAGRVVHARTRKPQPASSDFNALLDRYAWLVCRLAVRSACCTKADLASCRLGSTSYCIDTCCLPRRILQHTEPPNRS